MATILLIKGLKALKIKKNYTFIFNIKDFRKINIIIFKSNKMITFIKVY